MEGETTRNVERSRVSQDRRFTGFPRSAGGGFSGSQTEGRRFKSCPRYEENPWDTHIYQGLCRVRESQLFCGLQQLFARFSSVKVRNSRLGKPPGHR
jgi:hypothetical protein